MTQEAFPVFEFITGWAVFFSFLTLAFCIATLRSHVDETKIRKEESVSKVFSSAIPPEHVLTEVGLRRVKIAKFAVAVLFVSLVAIGIRMHAVTP
jgi:hypothetical protein